MRSVVTGSTLLITLILIILIHCTIIGNNARENEIHSGLNNSMDYAYDKMMDYFYDKDFITYYKELDAYGNVKYDSNGNVIYNQDVISDLMIYFCKTLQNRLGSNGELKVQLLYIDLDTGTFQIRVTEYFEYPFMGKYGQCMYEKTYSLY